MSDSLAADIKRLTQRVEAARAARQEGSPPPPEELAGLLARCRALAQHDAALDLGSKLVDLILELAQEQGPQYLAALDREQP